MKKTRNLLKKAFVIFTVASMLFVTACHHDVPQEEPGTEKTQDNENQDIEKDDSDSKDSTSDDDAKDDDSADSQDDSSDEDSKDEPEQEDKDPEATLKIVIGEKNQVKFTYSEDEENNTLTFTAEDGYDSYEWKLVGSTKPLEQKTGKSITISLEDFTDSFSIMLMAAKNGIVYTTNMLVDVCPPARVNLKKIEVSDITDTDVVLNLEFEKPVSKDFAKVFVYENSEKIAESKEGADNVTFTLKKEILSVKRAKPFGLSSVDASGNISAPVLFDFARCGEDLYAVFQLKEDNETVKSAEIFGTGDMYDYEVSTDSPFTGIKDFSCITISKDCTKFGKYAFPSISTKEPIRIDRDIELSPLSFKEEAMVIFPEMDCDNGDGTLYAQVVAIIGEDTVGYMLAINGEGYMKACNFPGLSYPWESYKDKIQMVYIGSGCKTIECKAFYEYPYLSQLVFEENSILDSIKDTAFSGTAIEKLEVPASVTSLAGFSDCKNLKEVIFAEDCKLSGISDFYNTAIEKIKIPASVQTITPKAFKGCTQLKELTFETPLYVLIINENAFAGTKLTEVTLYASKEGNETGYYGDSFPEDCTVTGGIKLD